MVIVKLQGGQGNQMFQYACGRALALRTGSELRLDLHFLLDRKPKKAFAFRNYELGEFRICQSFASEDDIRRVRYGLRERVVSRLQHRAARSVNLIHEPIFGPIRHEVLNAAGDVYLDGYWQSPAYFSDCEGVIRNEFALWDTPTGQTAELKEEIQSKQSVCIHVRRTDFLECSLMGACSLDYYEEATRQIAGQVGRCSYYVFSDDVEWCSRAFTFLPGVTIVDSAEFNSRPHWHQNLMQSCRHFVLSNSTFAWWAAFLSDSPDKLVFAPRQWFQDEDLNRWSHQLMPPNWMRI